MKEDTKIIESGRHPEAHYGIVNPPVYRASTVLSATLDEFEDKGRRRAEPGVLAYGRFGTPTTSALTEAVAALEGGHAGLATASGLNAISTALMAFLAAGDHLLMVDSAYRPTRVFCDNVLAPFGVEVRYYEPLVGAGIAALMRPETRVVFVESPGSLSFEVQDVPAIAAAAHEGGAVVVMDNTWASPLFFKPFAHGVDVSIQAATKYIVGHADALIGTVTATEEVWPRLQRTAHALGVAAGADDCYLAQRGLRTLGVRLRQHERTGVALAEWLSRRPEVERVLYPALADDPGHELWRRDFTGASGLFGVVLKETPPRERLAAMLDGLAHFGLGSSWGAYESLMVPTRPELSRSATTWAAPGRTLRVHAGLEDVDDLIEDLEQGFARLSGRA